MKALAILKDSFLETIDFKLFYVLIILSLVMALGVACFQFKQYPAEQVLQANFRDFGQVRNVKTLEESIFSPYGRYRFELAMRSADEKGRFELQEAMGESIVGRHKGFSQLKIEPSAAGADSVVEVRMNWGLVPHSGELHILFGVWKVPLRHEPRGAFILVIQSLLVNAAAGMVGMVIAIIVTAGFIPNMLRKGTVDFLLVKPISRATLLIYKYLGGLIFVFFNAVVLVGSTWLAFGFTTNNWSGWYLLSALVLTGYFAILYSFSVLIGVLTRSMLASVLLTIGLWFFLGIVGEVRHVMHMAARDQQISRTAIDIVDGIHWVLPKPGDLKTLNTMVTSRASGMHEILDREMGIQTNIFSWPLALSTSAAYVVLFLGIACWRFSRQDY